ncbi:MAG: hypothetical protein K2N82_05545 [Lachnospiraceae bacterium]|nr:hypothetical protein [Lachnospiraceae bacterium]
MKRRIFKLKNILLKKETGKKALGIALLVTIFATSAGTIMPVHGEELLQKTVITEIYHKHIGNSEEKGGCYQQEIPHIHQGNEAEGGNCYQTEIKHVHQGDESSGTGCYSQTVYHTHQGDGQSVEGCYAAVYHTHEEVCYTDKICTIRYTKGKVIGSEIKECDAHGQSVHERAEGIGSHVNCDIGDEDVHLEYCRECGIMSYSYHDYQELICGKDTETAEDYVVICGKDETTVEGYETGCGFKQGSVEKFALSCEKKAEGYIRNCGLDEKTPVGQMIVTNETEGESEKVTISVRIEDLSGGKLLLDEPPFVWYDETGKKIGNGKQIEVEKNGKYTAEVRLQNPDVDESSLRSVIAIDNVSRKESVSPSPEAAKSPLPAASATPEAVKSPLPAASVTPEAANSPLPVASATPGVEKEKEEASTGESQPTEKTPDEGEEALPKETPSPTPVMTADEGTDDGGDGNHRALEGTDKEIRDLENEESDEGFTEETVGRKPVIRKEVIKKEAKENMTSLSEPVEVKKTGFWQRVFADPKVRIFSIAAGMLLLLSGLLVLLLYFLRSVRIYNDDGQGRFVKLGRCPIRLEEEGYAVTISEQIAEKAYTNRYCIKPGLFRLGKEQQEILVYKDTKRVSAKLEKEMIFVI